MNSSSWIPSDRQKFLIENLNHLLDVVVDENNHYYIQDYRDFYWNVWDYFDDYNNKNEDISKEEMDQIILILDKFFDVLDDNVKR